MAIQLGKEGDAPPIGTDVISATFTEECEAIDITNRTNAGTGVGYRLFNAGFKTQTWEIECHDPAGLTTSLDAQLADGSFQIVSVSENASIDGARTFTVTLRRG